MARRRLEQLQALLRRMRRLLPLPLPDLITAAVHALEVDLALLEMEGGGRALADLEALREHATSFARTAQDAGLAAYLDLLEISEDEEAGLAVTAPPEHTRDPDAVTVVTMHSAKGLEWDLVAVAGLTEGTVPSYDLRRARTDEAGRVRVAASGWLGPTATASVPTGLRGDADTLPDLAWAEADTQVDAEELIEQYQFDQGEESLREDRRLMYVAVTRARRRLLLSSAAWRMGLTNARPRSRYLAEVNPLVPEPFRQQQEVPEHNPLDSVLETALWPPEPGAAEQQRDRAEELLRSAERGDLGGELQDPQLAETVRRTLADLRDQQSRPVVHSPPRLSASQLVRQAQDPIAAAQDLLRPLPRRPSAAARRGTAFHAWLESRYDDAALIDLDDLAELTDDLGELTGGAEEVDGAAETMDAAALREAFAASEWATRTPIAVEQPVLTRVGGIAVRGIIDAVFAVPEGTDGSQGVIIVDWKTGRAPSPSRLTSMSLQLSLYRLAWHEATGLPLGRIRTAFHFVPDGITHEVPRHPSAETIGRMLTGQ